MAMMILVYRLMVRYFYFFYRISRISLFFLECPSRVLGGFTWRVFRRIVSHLSNLHKDGKLSKLTTFHVKANDLSLKLFRTRNPQKIWIFSELFGKRNPKNLGLFRLMNRRSRFLKQERKGGNWLWGKQRKRTEPKRIALVGTQRAIFRS